MSALDAVVAGGVAVRKIWTSVPVGELASYIASNNTSSAVFVNFLIGATIIVTSTFISSLGFILQASSLERDRIENSHNIITIEEGDDYEDGEDEEEILFAIDTRGEVISNLSGAEDDYSNHSHEDNDVDNDDENHSEYSESNCSDTIEDYDSDEDRSHRRRAPHGGSQPHFDERQFKSRLSQISKESNGSLRGVEGGSSSGSGSGSGTRIVDIDGARSGEAVIDVVEDDLDMRKGHQHHHNHRYSKRNSITKKVANGFSKVFVMAPYSEFVEELKGYQWHIGFSMYLLSQIFGGLIALSYISPVVIAPLGSFGLIFNVILSYFMLGETVTNSDILGTGFIVFGSATISTFASAQPESRDGPKLDDLYRYMTRPTFVWYFSIQLILVVLLFSIGKYLEYGPMIFKVHKETNILDKSSDIRRDLMTENPQGGFDASDETEEEEEAEEEYSGEGDYNEEGSNADYEQDFDRPLMYDRKHSMHANTTSLQHILSQRKTQLLGGIFATCGGVVASETLLMTKAGVDVVVGAFFESTQRSVGIKFIVAFLVLLSATSVLQLYSLNRSLRYALPTTVIPTFYTFFCVFSLVNMVVFLDQFSEYGPPDIVAISIGFISLITGVYFLAGK